MSSLRTASLSLSPGLLALCLLGASCGGDDPEPAFSAQLEDHESALTAQPGDSLFLLRVQQAPESYDPGALLLTYQAAGGSSTQLEFRIEPDSDGDGRLGAGDSLLAIEPGLDLLGEQQAGTPFEIELFLETAPSQVRSLWSGTWQSP